MRKKTIETTEMLKDSMGNALLELMKEKPLEKITIEEMTKKADVGRATFFRHFKSKEDLISYRLIGMYKEYMSKQDSKSKDDLSHAKLYFDYYIETREIHLLILEAKLESAIFNAYLQLLAPASDSQPSEKVYVAYYIAYGLFGTTMKWLKDGCKETSEEMAKLCLQLISSANEI